jgi:NitT/TauT family transport system ATP-binding protein
MLDIDDVTKTYASRSGDHVAVAGVTLTARLGEFVSVVGPSGCGKSKLLQIVAGLLPASGGQVRLAGVPVVAPPAGLAIVFQDYARSLFPWLTARANVALPLKDGGRSRAEIQRITDASLDAVRLGDIGDRYPWQLSGGMQQRVSIARALAMQPRVLLLDEPFASVDAQTRAELEDLMLDVWARYGMTVVLVTHDIDEAVYLSDRVVVLTPSPARVAREVDVPLPRPRNQIETKETDAYLAARAEILTLVMGPRAAGALDRSL